MPTVVPVLLLWFCGCEAEVGVTDADAEVGVCDAFVDARVIDSGGVEVAVASDMGTTLAVAGPTPMVVTTVGIANVNASAESVQQS